MISLKDNCNGFSHGHIFKLREKSTYKGAVKIDDDSLAVFVPNSYYVYINSKKIQKVELEQLFEKLQQALDYLSVRGIHDSAVKMPINHFFSWEFINHKYSLSLTNRIAIGTHSIVGDISHLEVKKYHEGFRFFRLAQVANDLYDSYRSLWLSFEALITIHTDRKKSESEYLWYCRALSEFEKSCNDQEFKELVSKKEISKLMTELYTDVRCSLFHSKHGKNCLIPNKIKEYEQVKKALNKLTIVVLALIKENYKIQSASSWTNPDTFIDAYKKHFENSHILITNCTNEKKHEEEILTELLEMTKTYKVSNEVVKKETCVEHKFSSKVNVESLNTEFIQRFSYIKDHKELLIFNLEEQLSLKCISNIEVIALFECKFIEKPRSYDYRI